MQISSQKTIYWGAYIKGGTYNLGEPPWDTTAIDVFESHAKKKISILHWGQPWWDCTTVCGYMNFQDQVRQYEAMRKRGIIPLVDWSPWDVAVTPVYEQPDFALSTILRGDHDSYIRRWATEAKNWGHPFFLRFAHEMNGDWFPWSERRNGNTAGQYVQVWRHIHELFVQVGATNITWVWCPNTDYPGATSLASLYPGDTYVDWTCLDGYNWGTHPPPPGNWVSFSDLFGPSYDIMLGLAPTKPMMIGETASTEIGGSKATWIKEALGPQLFVDFTNIEAVLWFNWNASGMDWVIESSQDAQDAFANAVSSSNFASSEFTSLNISPIPRYDQIPRSHQFIPLVGNQVLSLIYLDGVTGPP